MSTLLRILLLAAVLTGFGAADARAEGEPVDVAVVIEMGADGAMTVTETFTGEGLASELTRIIPLERDIDSSSFYNYAVADVTASADGSAADVATVSRDSHIEVAIATAGAEEVALTYTVDGATRSEMGQDGDVTVLEWPALGGLSAPVGRFVAEVQAPGAPQLLDCVAGPPGSVAKCALIAGGTFEQPLPSFQDGPRDAGDEIVLTVAYPSGSVAATADVGERWSLDRAFDVSWLSIGLALLGVLLGVALLYLLHRRTGRDVAHDGEVTAIGSFAPVGNGQSVFVVPEGVRPGHVGTVADERVDPVDITATLIDLAVRGHLRITELPHEQHGLLDWQLEPKTGSGQLAGFEQELLDALAPATRVSGLRPRLDGRIEAVQAALYDDVVARGWFASRPDATRSWWRIRGYIGMGLAALIAALLVAFTPFGLLAMVVLAIGGGLLWLADRMPRRTAAGSALVTGLQALSALLITHPTDHMPEGRELEEISKLLGYTVVLGGRERWLAALVDADATVGVADPTALDWYHAPETWHLQHLPASLTQFINVVQGELFAR